MKSKVWQRVFALFSAFVLILNSVSPLLQVVYANDNNLTPTPTISEDITPTPTADLIQAISPTPTETPTPDPTATLTPDETTVTPTITPTPEITIEPTPTVIPEQTIAPTPSSTLTPTPTPTETSTGNEEVSMVILKNVSAPTIDLDAVVAEGSAALTTDKPDYAPTDTALITGSNLNPNEQYTLIVSSDNEPKVNFETSVTANENGVFIYAYQLDGTYRPNYSVVLKNLAGTIVATTTFTDADIATITSTQTGNWNAGSTWIGGIAPTATDIVVIASGTTVSTAGNQTCAGITINGTLSMTTGNILTVNGDVNGSGTLTMSGAITINFTGNWTYAGTMSNNNRLNVTASSSNDQAMSGTLNKFNVFTVNKSGGILNINGPVTTNGNLTMTAGTFNPNTNLVTIGGTLSINGGKMVVGATTWAGNYSKTDTAPAVGSTIEYSNANPTINGAITYQNLIFSGTGTAGVSAALTIQGDLLNTGGGALGFGTRDVTLSGAESQSIAGFTTTGTVSMTKSGGTATFTSNVNGGDLTINRSGSGTGVTLSLGAGLTHTFTGVVTLTDGVLNGGSSTLNENAVSTTAWKGTGSVFSPGTGTVSFGATGNQTISASSPTFNNIAFTGSGTKSIPSATTVGGNFSANGATASLATGSNISVNSLTLGGLGRINGTWGSILANKTNKNNTYFASTTGYLTVLTDTRTIPTVNTLPTASGITYGQALSASTLSGGTASTTGSFAFTAPATISPAGTYSAAVTFTPTDTTSYTTTTANVNVSVAKINSNVTTWPTASTIIYGQTLADSILSGGIVTPTGSFAFTTPSTVPNVGTALQNVTFTPTDNNYNLATGTVNVTVNPAPVSASLSTAASSPNSVAADGITSSAITITLIDTNSSPVSGKTVTLTSSRGATDTISAASGPSDINGIVTFTVKSSTIGGSTYTATDTTDSITITQAPTVSFTDAVAPVIEAHDNITAEATSASGATVTYTTPNATDNIDATAPASCTLASDSTFALGENIVICTKTDAAGNSATPTTFTVTVQDHTAPVIALNGITPDIEINHSYTELGATATDIVDGSFGATPTGSVDTTTVDSYVITYNAVDAHGNHATPITRTVNVIDSIADTFTALSTTLSAPGNNIVNNLNLVNANNVTSFPDLYFEKLIGEIPFGKITFSNALDLSSSETQTFLQNLGSKLDLSNGRIALDARTSAEFSAAGATLEMYNMPAGITSDQLIVRDDTGTVLDPTEIVSEFTQDPITQTVSFDTAHFTQFDIDTIAPETSDNVDGDWHNTTQTITLTCVDALSGCDKIYYTTDGTTPTTASTQGNSITFSADGTYTVKYFSTDKAGNTEEVKTADDDVRIDKSAPTNPGTPTPDTASPTNHNTLGWSWTAALDSISGVNVYNWTLWNGEVEALSGTTDGSTTSVSTDITALSDGIYTFKVGAEDNVGNLTDLVSSDPLTVDRAAPDTPVITTPPQTVNANTIHIIGTAESDSTVTITGGAATATETAAGGNYDITVTLTHNAINNLSVIATDAAGNESSAATVAITHDNTAPTVTKLGDGESDYSLPDLGDGRFGAGIVFSEELSTANKTNVENALTIGSNKPLTFRWGTGSVSNRLRISVADSQTATFANDVTANVTDLVGNTATNLLIVDSKLADNQTAPDDSGSATANSTTPQVVITNPTQAVNITIASGTTDPTINVSSFITGGTGTIPQITINSDNADISIPSSTTVTSTDSSWDGVIAAPTVTTVTLPETSGETKTLSTAIEVGFASAKLSFDKAVRILFPGQAGKRVGYSRPGTDFTEITDTCAADDQTTGDALVADGNCKIDLGLDLVIWTKHFTKFATYTQTTNASSTGNSSSSTGGVGDGLSDGLGCSSHDCSSQTSQGQVLGVSTLWTPALTFATSGTESEVLGTTVTNPEEQNVNTTPTPEKPGEVLGNETSSAKSKSNLLKTVLGTIAILLVIGTIGYWFSRIRKRV